MAQFLTSISATNGQVTAVTFAHPAPADLAALSGVSKLLGSGSASSAVAEITLGAGLSMSGNTLTATATGSGTVTSVGMTVPAGLAVAGSPITTSGTLALTWSGQIPNANGGTGVDTHQAANGTLLIGNGAGLTLATLTAGSGVSITNGAGSITISATGGGGTVTSVSGSGGSTGLTLAGGPITTSGTLTLGGTLNTTSGGTGLDTHLAANGSLLIGNGSGLALATLTAGSGISIANGAGSIQISATGGTGTVTSVNASGGTTGLGFTGGPITTSGTLTLAGTLAVANGGTGSSMAAANGQLLIGNGTGYTLATITAGANVTITNSAGGITIAAAGGSPTGAASGDLSGSYPGPAVAKLQGVAVSSTAPAAGQALAYSGTAWTPGSAVDGGVWTPAAPVVRSTSGVATTANSLSVAAPAGVVNGDTLLAVGMTNYSYTGVDLAPPSGWTAVSGYPHYFTGNMKVYAWTRTASSEPASYTFTSSVNAYSAVRVVCFAGAAAVDAAGATADGSGTTTGAPGVTAAGPNRLVVAVWPAAYTATRTVSSLSGSPTVLGSLLTSVVDAGGFYGMLEAATYAQASAGATGTQTATWSGVVSASSFQIAFYTPTPVATNQGVQAYRGHSSSLPTLADGQLGLCTDTHGVWVGYGGANYPVGPADPGLCEARLTLASGTPVTTADVTGAATVYLTPYKGNRVSLYTASAWKSYALAEVSIALGTLTSGLPHDVFLYDSSGTLTLQIVPWSSTSARATALALQDGVWCKSGDLGKRYCGTFHTTSTATTEDSAVRRCLWNAQNRVRKPLLKSDGSTYTYTTAAWRQSNANSANAAVVVAGLAESLLDLTLMSEYQTASAAAASVGIGEDSTTAAPVSLGGYSVGEAYAWPVARLNRTPAAGYHYYPAMEYGAGTVATTWYQFALSGSIDC